MTPDIMLATVQVGAASHHIRVHREAEGCWADSPDVPGWYAAAGSEHELLALAEEGLAFHLNPEDPR